MKEGEGGDGMGGRRREGRGLSLGGESGLWRGSLCR